MKSAVTAVVSRFTRVFARDKSANGKRVLVNEILSIQVISAALIGALAIASLYWGGQWVLQDNYGRWALQWTEELNELGSPLFLADDGEALIRLESYVDRYPEIDRVAYYDENGSVLFAVGNGDDVETVDNLAASLLSDAKAVVGQRKPYLMHGGILDPRKFEVTAPVWIESIPDDGLFEFDPTSDQPESRTQLIGFVGIHLDFVMFHDQLLSNIRGAVLILMALLILFGLYGRRTLRKALASISDLQKPIEELAKGNLDVKFEPAEHR
ncbi:MAG: hypothetical protein OEM60_01745, partial [Gammaproteobacteria bacterium]|nr:hypothetical protein [Gammaproteobacteria bacterium]